MTTTPEPVDVIWTRTVDDETYRAVVVGIEGESHTGILTVSEIATGMTIHTQSVGLSYGAVFGPDVADVALWESITLSVIDDPANRRADVQP